MVQALLLLKFEPILPLAAWFADRLAEIVRVRPADFPVDVVIPVPLHPQRQRERGYNQAGLTARPLARKNRHTLPPHSIGSYPAPAR